jgi:hypothetical protein
MMSKLLARACLVFALMFTSIAMTGCEEKITQENFDQITTGMTMSQVETLLGGKGELQTTMGGSISAAGIGTTEVTMSNTYKWEQGVKIITVTMKDGKVADKGKAGF